jgi:hypothetical protein
MPNEEEVLTAIRELDANRGGKQAEIRYTEVAERLGCEPDDPDLQRYLARASSSGLIEATSEVDQLAGPTSFR